MNQKFDPGDVGEEIGIQSMQSVIANAGAYCAHEERRISLKNQAEILALRAEFSRLLRDEQSLEDRLRDAPSAAERGTTRRRGVYYWTITGILALAGFIFSLLSFDPFRFGWKSVLYCCGIAVVTPFLVEKVIDVSNAKALVKWFAIVACVAALLSLGLLAVIRGDLFGEQMKNAEAPVIVEDDPSATPQHNTFYETTVPLLRMVMVLLALAMELGAGLALHDAWRLSLDMPETWEGLERELRDVRGRMTELIYEITRLQNESGIFASRFWRNFYRAVLTHAVRSAMTKVLLITVCLMMPFAASHAATTERTTLVIAIDLTQSVAEKNPEGRTDYGMNIDAVTKILGKIPSDCRVVVLGITDRSFAEPYVLLSAQVTDDPGYFGERLQAARKTLVGNWRHRAQGLTPKFQYTDIFGALLLVEHIFDESAQSGHRVLVVFSDMRHHTREVNLESVSSVPSLQDLGKEGRKPPSAMLRGVEVYVLGVDGAGKSLSYWESLKAFWTEYFQQSGARLQDYTPLRRPPLFE